MKYRAGRVGRRLFPHPGARGLLMEPTRGRPSTFLEFCPLLGDTSEGRLMGASSEALKGTAFINQDPGNWQGGQLMSTESKLPGQALAPARTHRPAGLHVGAAPLCSPLGGKLAS